MTAGIHYEVFLKKHKKSGWALQGAIDDRDKAIREAKALLKEHPAGSVRVSKEKFNDEDRTYRSSTIFEEGAEKFGAEKEKKSETSLPCMAPDDLSKPSARDTIRRALSGWLERMKIVPMELLHRPDLAEKLEASGTELQHAVQKVAVASAKDSDASVHAYVKQLNELVKRALTRLYQDGRNNKLPGHKAKTPFHKIAEEIHRTDARGYMIRAAMADQLKDIKSYEDKIDALLDWSENLPSDEAAAEFAIVEVDAFLSEVISFEPGMAAMLGQTKDIGQAVERLVCLYDGDPGAGVLDYSTRAAKRLAARLGENALPECKAVICRTLLKELEKPRRLRPSSMREEVRLSRELAQKLVMTADGRLPADTLMKIFSARSARLLQPENIEELLKSAQDADQELAALIHLAENLVGDQNRCKLAGYIRSVLGSSKTESHYIRGPGRPLERLASIANHQRRAIACDFPEEDAASLARAFDALGLKIVSETKILNAIDGGPQSALDKAAALLKLCSAGALPLGDCLADAQARALRHLKSDRGLAEAKTDEAKAKLKSIRSLLQTVSGMKAPGQAKPQAGQAA